jgi:hypothetical protein
MFNLIFKEITMKQMSTQLINECIEVIQDYSGVSLTQNQFLELMADNPQLNKQLIKYNSPGDTMDREDMLSALGRKLTGRDWPIYMDGPQAMQQFTEDFESGARRLGYKLLKEHV